MRNKALSERLISIMIALALSCMFFTGCAKDANKTQDTTSQTSRNTESVAAESIAETITNDIQNTNYYNTETDEISYKIEDYAGNLDAFVYGLIKTEYESYYSVFNAAIDLPNGDTVYGIGYTDYADCYESDDGIKFFPAGFVSLIGEPAVPKSITEDGLEIIDLDYDNPNEVFQWVTLGVFHVGTHNLFPPFQCFYDIYIMTITSLVFFNSPSDLFERVSFIPFIGFTVRNQQGFVLPITIF